MKWIVYALLLANLGYFAFHYLADGDEGGAVASVEAQVERQLVQSLPSAQPTPVAPVITPNVTPDACVFLSPVSGELAELRTWLAERDVSVEFIESEHLVATNYLVVMPPLATYDDAVEMQQALDARGFDSFMMVDEYANGLSLGYFSKEENAVNYIARLASSGFTTELLEKPVSDKVTWLKLTGQSSERYRQLAASVQEAFGQIKVQRNSCQGVAL